MEGVGGAFGYLGGLAEGAAALAPTAGEVAGTLAGAAGVGAALLPPGRGHRRRRSLRPRARHHGVVRVLQAAQLRLRLQEAVLLPGRADGGHVLPRVGQQWILEPASLSQKVTNAPMSFAKARTTVTLCSATPYCCVCTVGS